MTQPNSLAGAWVAEPMGRVAAPIREQVIAALRQAILDFQLKPGQRLVERELIEQLGVSRTTIRESLRELASEGLVTVVPQRGAMVSAPSLDEAMDLYEIRGALESLLVKHFVERASDEEVQALQDTVEEIARVCGSDADVRTILAAKDKFYAVLVPGARSAALQQLIDGIRARVQLLRATSLSAPGRPTEVVAELRGIAEAVANRDADRASELCAAHIRNAAMTALHALQEEPDSTD